ncbi:putative disease resistance RPP13-like protein 3 isoform X2 [Setaria italica]|uniref:putative disease resistance RPP13-like protein 3 isoform X2 n=1 Tax=Setaria italica TaxID=4555 RepID=UPI000646CFD6|nr:putative disease resistance RPP13-like protein 3 isoform X2 [Setaria italica]
MEVVTGALPSVITKLAHLAAGEYNLQKGLNGEIKFLQKELESMKGALEDISKNPPDQLPNGEKIWAGNVRELSYDIEDSIDMFMVQSKGRKLVNQHGLKKAIGRSLDLLMQPKIRRKIATEIREIKSRVIEVHERRRNYKVKIGVDKPVTAASDPRLSTPYLEVKDLVGIDGARDEIIKIMTEREEVPMQQGKIVSIVGFGGLGKTTLAKAVYEKIRAGFDCSAFVSVSENPDSKKLLKGLLYDLGKSINEETLDEMRLINILKEFLQDKRYIIVLDDIWDISVWKLMRGALPDNDAGYRIITTTRNFNVGQQVGGTYKLKPLCLHDSKILLYRRIFANEDKDECPDEQLVEVSDKILKKCAGVPLAIIMIASLLARKGGNIIEWYKVYKSMGTGLENDPDVSNMREILSLSYYDMPSHLRTCLLYLSLFPEDYMIHKVCLINLWIAEGFIQRGKQGQSLFDVGESYFNDLLNRSMIQPMHDWYSGLVQGCKVHDMVLDLICSFSNEENFITILNDMENTSSNTIRRLSLQSANEDHSMTWTTKSLQQVRIGNMACLEYLLLRIDDSTMDSIEEMGQLLELRVLRIVFNNWNNNLVEYLSKLQKIRNLYIEVIDGRRSIGGLDAWVAPQHLCRLNTVRSCWFSALPAWMNRSVLPNLSFLWIAVRELQLKDLEILGRLPALRSLELEVDRANLGIHGRFDVGAGLFPCLVHCKFWGFVEPVVFRQGAMPRLRELYLDLFFMWEAKETTSSDGGLDMGIRNLPLLQDVFIELRSEVASTEEVEHVKATLRRAAEFHPNHPRLTIL